MNPASSLRRRLLADPVIGVVGLGYVGLPLAVAFAQSGASVIGVDVDGPRVARINEGVSFVEDVPTAALAELVSRGRFRATDEFGALRDADAIVICVPTPLGKSKDPDISSIVNAANAVAGISRPAQIVVLESTTYPGTTQEVLLPRLEANGLKAGVDFFLAFSPERIDPGTGSTGSETSRRSPVGSRPRAGIWPRCSMPGSASGSCRCPAPRPWRW